MKTCTKCNRAKALDEFYVKDRQSGRRETRCTECLRAYHRVRSRKYYAAHRDERRAYYEANRERIRERNRSPESRERLRAWQDANRERIREYPRDYDQIRRSSRAWREANPLARNVARRRREGARQRLTAESAPLLHKRWTEAEDSVAMDPNLTIHEAAFALGRTYYAVWNRRRYIRRSVTKQSTEGATP